MHGRAFHRCAARRAMGDGCRCGAGAGLAGRRGAADAGSAQRRTASPVAPVRAMYMLTERGNGSRLVEVDIPRVYSEIRFENRPGAVALPLYSFPGTSGSPIIDLADGLLLGMVVGYLDERPDIAAVVPAQTIYDALVSAAR